MVRFVKVLAKDAANGEPESTGRPSATETCVLEVGDDLFREADPRTCVYQVEKGLVAVFERRSGSPPYVLQMAGQGDYVGLGCLERHRDNARAVVESVVSIVPRREFASLVERDPKLRQEQDDAVKKDFEYGRALARDRGAAAPIDRVAAYLVAISRQNATEGRDPTVIADSMNSGAVAYMLDLDISTLGRALLELQGMGLVEQHSEADLHLTDIESLEHIAARGLHSTGAACSGTPPAASRG